MLMCGSSPTCSQCPQDFMNWNFICTLIVKVCHLLPYARFYWWISVMNYYMLEIHFSLPLCMLFSLTIIPFPHPSFLLSLRPSHSLIPAPKVSARRFLSPQEIAHHFSAFSYSKIIIGCLLSAITVIDPRNSAVSKTGTVHVLLLIWKKIKLNII